MEVNPPPDDGPPRFELETAFEKFRLRAQQQAQLVRGGDFRDQSVIRDALVFHLLASWPAEFTGNATSLYIF